MQTKIIIPVSGGKDSLLCLLLAIETHGKENCIPLFNDTGWEHPETYSYLKRLEEKLGIEITKTENAIYWNKVYCDIPSLIIAMQRFPWGRGRFCSNYFKIQPTNKWIKQIIKSNPNIIFEIWYGMRSAESTNRKKKYGKLDMNSTYDFNEIFPKRFSKKDLITVKVKLPILELSTDQVFKEIRNRKIELNPLYFEGTNDRVGCYPCFLASKPTQQKMFNTEFGKIQLAKIRKLEKIIGKKYENIQDEDAPCGFCLI